MTLFRELFTFNVTHTYYDETCRDFQIVLPTETQLALKRGRMIFKEIEGTLYVVYETDGTTSPKVPIAGMRLRIGLRLANPYFSNVTTVDEDFASTIRLYRNEADPDALDAPTTMPLAGSVFTHTLVEAARPLTVTLLDENENVVSTETVTDVGQSTAGFDAGGWPEGLYTVREINGAIETDHPYYIDPELLQQGVSCVIEIDIDSGFYATAPEFEVAFTAKQETLKYYVVTQNYSEIDFNNISIADAGYTEDGRAQVTFIKVASGSFTASEIPLSILESGGDRIVLFKSNTLVSRRERGRKKIQLSKNGELLIANLPQPGPEKTDADMIIHLSKP